MASKPFSALELVFSKRAREAAKSMTSIMKKAANTTGADLVDATPVDKGDARSNWVGTLDVPNTTVLPAYAPGLRLGRSETANASAAVSQQALAFSRFNVNKNKSLVITNRVPYIGKLDGTEGSPTSPQQPDPGFVRRSVLKGINSIRGEKVFKN